MFEAETNRPAAPDDAAATSPPPAGAGNHVRGLPGRIDDLQRHHKPLAVTYGVVKKFSNDEGSLLVVGLGWYGFTAIYPALLVAVTVMGYIGVASLGHQLVHTLQQFPVIGDQVRATRGSSKLHGSILGLIVGLAGLLYGAQGVTQVAQKTMSRVWNLPTHERPTFLPRLGRSVAALIIIGVAFLANAGAGTYATAKGRGLVGEILIIAAMLVVNVGFYTASFRILTPRTVAVRELLPGAIAAAVGFTLLITVGTGLIQHMLRNESATYGAFASVIGTVTFLLLLAKLTVYAAELNPVLHRNLYPRSLRGEPTAADHDADQFRLAELATVSR